MSDIANEHEPVREVAVLDIVEPTLAPGPTSAVAATALPIATSVAASRRNVLEWPATVSRSGHAGRIRRSSTGPLSPAPAQHERGAAARIHRSPVPRRDTASAAAGLRIQRSPSRGPIAEPVPVMARIQPMAREVTIRRDFTGAMKSAGRGIRAAAKATGTFAEDAATSLKNAAAGVAQKIHRSDFNDLNATQYLVSGGGKIEAINRRVEVDGTVAYYRTGSVTVGDGDRPTIEPYDEPIAMPNGWLPTVTHINGMMVKPNGGLGSALRLQQELEKAGGEALLTTEVPSVLYTYSAHRGFVTDLAECVWGKLYQDDDATDRQTQIMLDAVNNQHRTTVSAHSRGTIKTDNAVRNAHGQLSATFLSAAMSDPVVVKQAQDAAVLAARLNPALELSPAMLEPVYVRLFAREQADRTATAELDKFVQLIYAGNAVQFPSASVNLNLVVAGSDPVTIGVGKYFGFAKGSKTKMTDVKGGHGFNANYAPTVATLIIADLQARQPK